MTNRPNTRSIAAMILLAALLMSCACIAATTRTLSLYDGSQKSYVASQVAVGQAMAVSAVIPETAGFLGWQVHDGLALTDGEAASPTLAFAMPDNDVTLGASFGTAQFLAGPSADDIPAYMSGTQEMTVAHDVSEGEFAVSTNTCWSARTASSLADGTAPSWLVLLSGGGFGSGAVRFRTTEYSPVVLDDESGQSAARAAYIILSSDATTVDDIVVRVTQLPPSAAGGLYYDLWNGQAWVNLLVEAGGKTTVVAIPDQTDDGAAITGIGSSAFQGNRQLTSVTCGSGLRVIGANAFKGCAALADMQFSPWLSAIRDGAFANCTSLAAANLADTAVKSIGRQAFENCTALTAVDFPTALTAIGDQAFRQCAALQPGTLPRYLEAIGKNAFAQTATTAFAVNDFNKTYRALDGVLFTRSDYTLVAYPPGAAATHYAVHSSTRAIATGAFEQCAQLKSVNFTDAESLTTIGEAAFANCTGLTAIQLPFAIESIGPQAFAGCSNLRAVVASDTQPDIADDAFQDCQNLARFYFYGGKPAIGQDTPLSPAADKKIYACKDCGWTNGESFAGCTVTAAPATSLYAVIVDNGTPCAYFAGGWPVTAMAYPSGTKIFSRWASVYGTCFSAQQLAANPVDFSMPSGSGVALAAAYVQPSFTLTLTNAKLSTGTTGGSIPADSTLRAIADMPAGAQFACWMSDTLAIDDTARTRQYLDFTMPFADTALHAATIPAGVAGALGYNAVFTTCGTAFWKKTAADCHSASEAACSSGELSYLATTATGPGYFTFYARMDAPESSTATLDASVDGQEPFVVLGSADNGWTPCSIYLPAGSHTIQWRLKNPAQDATAFIDSICLYNAASSRTLQVRNSSGSGNYMPGELVTLVADSIPGKGFVSWSAPTLDFTAEELVYPVLAFIMPNRDTLVTANYEDALLGIGPADSGIVSTGQALRMLDHNAASCALTVTANAPWTAESDASWLAVTPDSALLTADVTLELAANTSTAARTGRVVLEADNGERLELAVVQQPQYYTGFLHDVWNAQAAITRYIHDGSADPVAIPPALDGVPLASLAPGTFRNCPDIAAFAADEDNPAVRVLDGVLFTQDMATLMAYPPRAANKDYVIPESVSDIADYAFANCSELQSLTLSDAMTPDVFLADPFAECTGAIAEFRTHASNTTLSAVDGVLFSYDLDTLVAYPPGNSACAYAIPERTAAIADKAFANARWLNLLDIPDSVATIAGRPFQNLDQSLRFIVFRGVKPGFDHDFALPRGATVYIHKDTAPAGAWEAFIASQGNSLEYFQDDARLDVISAPAFISYDGQFTITIAVECTAKNWRIFRESMGEDDSVWMPCDATQDMEWLNLDWILDEYPVNNGSANRSQTLWLTADGCIPAVIAMTQLCRSETLTQNLGELPLGWNAIPVLCNPFTESVQFLAEQDAYIFEKHRRILRRATADDITGGTQIWLYVTADLQRTLPHFPITGQVIHSQKLPDARGWNAVAIAVADGFPGGQWGADFTGAWRWDGEHFVYTPPSQPLVYGNSYWILK